MHLSFWVLALLVGACSSAPTKDGYHGYGAGSVDSKTLEKYAPPALPSGLSRKVRATLDLRAPGAGELHPDGKRLFFSWMITGTRQIWRLDGPNHFPVQMTAGEDPTSLGTITPDGKWLVLSRDANGEENPGLYLQGVDGGALQTIQHLPKVQTHYQGMSQDSKWIYYASNNIKPDSYAIYRYEIGTGKKELLFSQDGKWSVEDIRSDLGKLLLMKATGNLAREVYEWDIAKRELKPLLGQGETEEYWVAYAADPSELLVVTAKMGDWRRLYRWKGGQFKPLSPELPGDVWGISIDPPRKHIVYKVNEKGYTRLYALDARTYKQVRLPEFKGADQVALATMDWKGRGFTLGVETSTAPRKAYSYEWATAKLTQWSIPSVPEMDASTFVRATLESYPARDGTLIPIFVLRPKQCLQAATPCPAIVHFHGGPESQSQPGFWAKSQLLVSEGFVVVEPNVRGSDGYGKKWLMSDNGPKRLDVVTDIEDCAKHIRTQWAVGGVAPKVGLMGWSYGGYSTLLGMTMFAGAYDAGVAMVGMSDLSTFLKNTAPYRRSLRVTEYGDPDKDAASLAKLSPITYLDRIKAPLLIIQGANDPRVPAGEAVRIQEALAAKKIPSRLILFADEGHGAEKRSNQVLEFGHLMQFFSEHLGTPKKP